MSARDDDELDQVDEAPHRWVCHLEQRHGTMGTYGTGASHAEALADAKANFRKGFSNQDHARPEYRLADPESDGG